MDIRSGTARSGDLDIYFEDMGHRAHPAVVLIMGLGAQSILWRDGFCELLVDAGYRVVRFDNRDVGLSSKVEGRHTGAPLLPRMVRSYLGKPSDAVYTLEHMADDVTAVLDHLEIERAHVVGASMGGMIAQVFAARYQHRIKTLGIIFSSNNQPLLPPPGFKQLQAVTTKPRDASREGILANTVRVGKVIGSPAFQVPEEQAMAEAVESYERSYYPAGVARHFGAILGSGSLLAYDKQITAPTVVIHGKADKLMRPSGGRAIAKAIRRARFVTYDGMGHDLPEPLWGDIVGQLTTTFAEVP